MRPLPGEEQDMMERLWIASVTGLIAFLASSAVFNFRSGQLPEMLMFSGATALWSALLWPLAKRAKRVSYLRATALGVVVPVLGLWLGLAIMMLIRKGLGLYEVVAAAVLAATMGIVGLAVAAPLILPLGIASALALGWLHNRRAG
jgi:hypothetical protein